MWKKTFETIHQLSCFVAHHVSEKKIFAASDLCKFVIVIL